MSRKRWVTDIYQFRNKYRVGAWLDKEYQFIHVPKCAGTSIAMALDLPDPGHFTFEQLKALGVTTGDAVNFAVVRNPVDRIVSTFKYARKAQEKNGPNPLSWIARFDDFDDFVCRGLRESDVENNYFFWSSCKYIEGCPCGSLKIIDFEKVDEGFRDIVRTIGLGDIALPKENVSKKDVVPVSRKTKDKIMSLYRDDYSFFPERLGVHW